MTLYIGDRVILRHDWGWFQNMRGKVTQVKPYVMVLLDGERLPMRFDEAKIELDEPSTINLTGAE